MQREDNIKTVVKEIRWGGVEWFICRRIGTSDRLFWQWRWNAVKHKIKTSWVHCCSDCTATYIAVRTVQLRTLLFELYIYLHCCSDCTSTYIAVRTVRLRTLLFELYVYLHCCSDCAATYIAVRTVRLRTLLFGLYFYVHCCSDCTSTYIAVRTVRLGTLLFGLYVYVHCCSECTATFKAFRHIGIVFKVLGVIQWEVSNVDMWRCLTTAAAVCTP